jgi:hypothetical protein
VYTAPSGRPSSYHGPWPWSVINLLKSPLVGRRILAVEGKSAMSNQHGAFAMTRAIAAIAVALMLGRGPGCPRRITHIILIVWG